MKKQVGNKLRGSAGFTLVELIVVIAILGILAGIGTVGYSGYIKKANEAADVQMMGEVRYAAILGGMEAPGTTGSITVGNSGTTASNTTIEGWLQDAFGGDWATTVKLKVSGSEKTLHVPVQQINLSEEEQQWADAVNSSGFGEDYEEVASVANTLTQALAAKTDSLAMLEVLCGTESYQAYMDSLVEQGFVTKNADGSYTVHEGKDTEIANTTALWIASQYNSADGNYDSATAFEAINRALNEDEEALVENFKNAGNGNALAGAALAYALTIGYANSDFVTAEEAAAVKEQANNVTGVTTLMSYMQTINSTENTSFKEYLNSDAAKNDVNGYLSAMQLVSNYGDSIDITVDGVYGNDSTLALLQAILGK